MDKMKHGTQSDPHALDRSIRATVDACIDPSRGTIVGMAYEAVYELAKELQLLRDALAEGPWVNKSDVDDSTLLEWFLPNSRLCVWLEGPVPTESSWSYAEKSGRINSGGLVPRTGEQK